MLAMSIAEDVKYNEGHFLKAKINTANYMVPDSTGALKEDDIKKRAEDMRMKEKTAIELRKLDAHENGATTLL